MELLYVKMEALKKICCGLTSAECAYSKSLYQEISDQAIEIKTQVGVFFLALLACTPEFFEEEHEILRKTVAGFAFRCFRDLFVDLLGRGHSFETVCEVVPIYGPHAREAYYEANEMMFRLLNRRKPIHRRDIGAIEDVISEKYRLVSLRILGLKQEISREVRENNRRYPQPKTKSRRTKRALRKRMSNIGEWRPRKARKYAYPYFVAMRSLMLLAKS